MKQKRIGKKAVSWLLTLVMLTGLLPMPTASAADATTVTTVTEGNTYYFDLSSTGILDIGKVNNSLPDRTMHYVPFTYAGSVDAYVLKEASSGEMSASVAASNAVAPDAPYGYTYDHRLFVADRAVTRSVSWSMLNDANLIFGKNYTSGGIAYSLRAPSAGSNSTGSDDAVRGDPANNEWDAILDKRDGEYIKNWRGSQTLGQDTAYNDATYRVVRVDDSARSWSTYGAVIAGASLYFRPVLELLSTDKGLKAVTLHLNSGKLGTSSKDIQIVVENGASFTAPASDGLTRPTGNTDTYFRWLGDDDELYAPGASVPATVTALTALYQLNPPVLDVPAVAAIEYRGEAVTVSRSDRNLTTDLTYTCAAAAAGQVKVEEKWYTADEGGNLIDELSSAPKDVGEYALVLTTAATDKYAAGRWERSFTIRPKEITIENCVAETKTYDGNTTATIKPGTLRGVVAGDDVTVAADATIAGTFTSADAGENIDVTTTNRFPLSGAQKDNYNLLKPTGIKGTITTKGVTITGLTAKNKAYDGNTTATTEGGTVGTLADGDVFGTDVTIFPGTAAFDSAGVGDNKTVTFSGYTLGGNKAGNYHLTGQPASVTASITRATWENKTATVPERPDVEKTVELADLIAPGGQLGTPSESGSMLTKCALDGQNLVFKIKNDVAANTETTVTIPVTNATNYADYNITVTITALDKLSISQEVLAAIKGYSGTYDAKAHNAVVTRDAVTADYTLTYSTSENGTYSAAMPKVTNVTDSGTVWVKVSRPGYADAKKSVTVTVSALDITGALITLNEIPTYSGNEETVTVASVTVGSGNTAVTLAAGDYTVSGDKATNVETKPLTVTGQANCTGTAQINWSLKPKSLSGEGVTTITLGTQATYNGQSQDVVITSVAVDGIIAELVKDTDYEIISGGSATNVADTTLTITGKGNFEGTATKQWTMSKASASASDFTVTAPPVNPAYTGSSISVTAPTPANGKTGLGTVTVYYAGSGTTNYFKDTQAPTNAGTYTVTFDVAEGTNYKAVNGLTIGTLTINPKEVTVTAVDKTAMVGDSVPSLGNPPVKDKDYTVEGLVGSDVLTGHSVKLAYASAPVMSQPGEYGIVPSAATANTNTNYTIRYVNGKLIVGGIVLPGKDKTPGNNDDVTVKPATSGTVITDNGDGSRHVGAPGGSVVLPGADQNKNTTGDNVTVTVTGEFDVKNDGTVSLPSGGSATVGGKTVTGPATIYPDGVIDVGAGGSVGKTGETPVSGPVVVLPGEDKKPGTTDDMTVKPVAPTEVTVDPGTGNVTVPENGKVDIDTDGDGVADKTVTGPATVKPDGSIKVESGGTVDTDHDGKPDIAGPAEVEPDGGVTGGSYILPGKDDAAGTADDVILTPANGGSATKNTDDGSYSVTGGGSVVLPGADQNKSTTEDNVTVTVNGPFTVKPDGTVVLPGSGSSATVGGKTVTGPATIRPDGVVNVGENGSVGKTGETPVSGPVVVLPGKDKTPGTTDDMTVKPVAPTEVTVDPGTGNVTVPENGKVDIDTDGDGETDVTVTGPATIKNPDGKTVVKPGGAITLPGEDQQMGTGDDVTVKPVAPTEVTVDPGTGEITVPENGKADVDTDGNGVADKTVTGPATVKPDGTVERPSSGGGGGGGGSSSTTYPPTVKDPDNGSVTVTPKNPSKGDNVMIRPNPDEGYEVDDVVVTKPDGSKVPVKDNGNGTWTFEQPSGKVTVKVTFKPVTAAGGSTYDKCPGGSGCPASVFNDISEGAWYHDGVHYCLDNGLMNGKSATVFDPNGTTTRGQIVAILWRLEGSPKVDAADFTDVASGLYYTDAVAWAAANGIVTGYADGSFKSNAPITREQMATILYRYCKYKGLTVSAAADLSGFADRNRIAPYAEEALAWANAVGLVNGKSASALDPTGSATRAQVATILMRFSVNIVNN